ncbi:MAG: hypothetical protein HY079_00765 [Elusimicrobia bacterium]|nr:hypothetical protein [Elusimicrobiota bacterium]
MKPGDGFDDRTAKLAADMLGPALLKEVAGTRAGDQIGDFYAKTPMRITIEPEETGNLATYFRGTLNFGRGDVEDFLKARGKTARDLVSQPGLMAEFVRELAPVFVHEATHHRQDVWATARGINGAWSQYQEVEAMETEAMYVLEKSSLDPTYKAYLAKSGANSPNAREALSLARRMETQGADQFRRSIRAWHYPGLLSLEGETWERASRHEKVVEGVRAELKRRDSLPPAGRALLENGPKLDTDYDAYADFLAALRRAGTVQLREALAAERKARAGIPGAYAQHRARADEADRAAETLLADLKAGKTARRPRIDVPSRTVFLGPKDKNGVAAQIEVRWVAPGDPSRPDADAYVDRLVKPGLVDVPGWKTHAPEKAVVAGRAARRVVLETSRFVPPHSRRSKEVAIREEHVVVPAAKGYFVLVYDAPASLAAKNAPAFKAVLAAFAPKD